MAKQIPLYAMAHGRSGDKGDGSNVGVLAYDDRGFSILQDWLTVDRVKAHFGDIVKGSVERFEMPNVRALNFLLHDSLGGGGSASIKTDAQGKTHAMAQLRMMVEVPDDYDPPPVGSPEYHSTLVGTAKAAFDKTTINSAAMVSGAARPTFVRFNIIFPLSSHRPTLVSDAFNMNVERVAPRQSSDHHPSELKRPFY